MEELAARVAALEQAYTVLIQSTIPGLGQRVYALEEQMNNVITRLNQIDLDIQYLKDEISGGGSGGSIIDQLAKIIGNNKDLIYILMSYASQRLLSPSNPNADSALWVNLNKLVGE